MSPGRIELENADFAVAVPFGFVVDTAGRLQVLGSALGRRLRLQPGHDVHEALDVVRPWRSKRFVDLPLDPRATIVLRSRGGELELRGNNLAVGDGRIAFVGSPVVRDIDDFQRRGLQLSDFAPSDATPELLLSMQATRTALEDARKLGAELKGALADAHAATDAKARFLAMMSHEIRTPLNGFGAMIDLLRDSALSGEQRDNLETMDLCARSLLVLVNDILDYSKLEAGKIELAPSPTPLATAMTQIVDHFRAAARERGVELLLRIECPRELHVMLDVERTRQVLANLIGNAIKFTEEGLVAVQVSGPADGVLTIDVLDTGLGIPQQNLARLFEPFVQGDSTTTRRFGGTGLGLSISRQLARALGGEVRLVNTGPGGTWFRFTLGVEECAPPRAQSAPTTEQEAAIRFANAHVLVVDDDLTNQRIAARMLDKLGVQATIVGDGQAAIDITAGRQFDLILMDMMMPLVDGLEATRSIRRSAGPSAGAPILAFSAAAFDADRRSALAAGMNGFLEKPVRMDTLRRALLSHLPEATRRR
ncbi:MAG: response regulator [Planctomycetes bacterium]|nr:response regulator [Planctomycetota bacterium]